MFCPAASVRDSAAAAYPGATARKACFPAATENVGGVTTSPSTVTVVPGGSEPPTVTFTESTAGPAVVATVVGAVVLRRTAKSAINTIAATPTTTGSASFCQSLLSCGGLTVAAGTTSAGGGAGVGATGTGDGGGAGRTTGAPCDTPSDSATDLSTVVRPRRYWGVDPPAALSRLRRSAVNTLVLRSRAK